MKRRLSNIKIRLFAHYQFIYFSVLSIFFRLITFSFDNDFWFSINQGRYILNTGFPLKAINSIHDIDFIYQSWGTGTLFYFIYNNLGFIGIIALLIIISLLTLYFFYKLCYTVSNNKKVSSIVTFLSMFLYFGFFLVTRPHIFTVLNFTILLFLLEKYFKTSKKIYLFFLPLISLLEINMHGIYFIVLLVIILPYLIDALLLKGKDKKSFKISLFITYVFMILIGFINPYTYKTIIYGFNSYKSNSLFNNSISELLSPNFHTLNGKIMIISIIITFVIYFVNKNKKIPIRYYLLLLGTSYLALDAIKSYYFFLIGSLFPIAFILKDIKWKHLSDKPFSKTYHHIHLSLTCILIVLSCFLIREPDLPKVDIIANYLDTIVENKKEVKLFTNFKDGSYLEYRGYNCYLDQREEIFLKEVNHKEDIFKEYDDLTNNKLDYREFLKKYNFDYLVIDKNDKIYYLLLNYGYENYKVIKEIDNYQLCERN